MKRFLTIFLLLFGSVVAFSQSTFNPDDLLKLNAKPDKLVNDYSNVLTSDQKATLEYKLDTFDKRTSSQLAVVIIPSLGDYDVADFNVKLGRAWGVGGKEHSNGVVLLVCTDPGNHKLNIATGYGMEGDLPDITCEEIINDIIVPNFKSGDYYGGIDQGADAIIKATQGEYTAPSDYGQQNLPVGKIFFIIIIAVIILSIIGRGGGGGFLGPFLIGNMLGGGGGWSSGGGSSGGGFGGFGGGSFGGGGASGSW